MFNQKFIVEIYNFFNGCKQILTFIHTDFVEPDVHCSDILNEQESIMPYVKWGRLVNIYLLLISVTIKVALTSSQTIDYKCSHADDIYFTTPMSSCTSYYKCSQNDRIKYNCPNGSKFDFYKQKCLNTAGKLSIKL